MLKRDPSLLELRNGIGETVLHYCAVEGATDVVRFLIGQRANPDSKNDFGASVLQECVSLCNSHSDNCDLIQLLIDHGADPYHFSPTKPCAWHQVQKKRMPKLKAIFADMPEPTGHEPCIPFDWTSLDS